MNTYQRTLTVDSIKFDQILLMSKHLLAMTHTVVIFHTTVNASMQREAMIKGGTKLQQYWLTGVIRYMIKTRANTMQEGSQHM